MRLSQKQRQEIATEYVVNGTKAFVVAEIFHVSISTVYRIAKMSVEELFPTIEEETKEEVETVATIEETITEVKTVEEIELEKELEGFDNRSLDEIIEKDFDIKMVERKKKNEPFGDNTVWTKERCKRVLKAFK